MRYLDQCHQAMRDGRTLGELASSLDFDTELLGRLLQLPAVRPVASTEPDLWAVDRLDAVL